MNKVSDIHDESEVLFMLGSIFCLNQICHDQSSAHARMSIIRMTLCSDHDNDLKQLYDHMKNEYHREETNLLSLGDVMLKMGKFDLAEKYYRRLLSELPSNDPSLSALYQRLGMVADAKGEYDTSLEWYQKSLEMRVRTAHPIMSILGTHTTASVQFIEIKVIIVEHWNRTIEPCHSSNKHTMRITRRWLVFTTIWHHLSRTAEVFGSARLL
jgi:hypothetical protein